MEETPSYNRRNAVEGNNVGPDVVAHFELPHLTVHYSVDPAEAAHNEPPHGSIFFADSSVILNIP